MMKARLAPNIDGHPLRLVSLFEFAYSNGANLILSYGNTNKDCGPGFSRYFVSQAKVVNL